MRKEPVDAEKELFDFLARVSDQGQWIASTRVIVPQVEKYEARKLRKARQWVSRKLMHHVQTGLPFGNWKIDLYGTNSRGHIYRGMKLEPGREGTVP